MINGVKPPSINDMQLDLFESLDWLSQLMTYGAFEAKLRLVALKACRRALYWEEVVKALVIMRKANYKEFEQLMNSVVDELDRGADAPASQN